MPTAVLGPAEGMAYILAKLQADSTLTAYLPAGTNGIFRFAAPQAAINNPPYIIITYQGGADVMGSFADRLMTSGLYQVSIYGPDSMYDATLYPAAQRIDTDLHRTSGTAQGGTIIACYREQPLVLSEVIAGSDQVWTRAGGLYRALVY